MAGRWHSGPEIQPIAHQCRDRSSEPRTEFGHRIDRTEEGGLNEIVQLIVQGIGIVVRNRPTERDAESSTRSSDDR
jgi:hypothetical protein